MKRLLIIQGAFVRTGLPLEACIGEALFGQAAGSDTTAAAIRCTMLYLMTTPRVYQKLKQVVKEAVEQGQVSSPITHEEAKKIPYLQVRETSCRFQRQIRNKWHKLILARL